MRASETYYDVLQVSPGACNEVLEAAYRVLQKQLHPDVGGEVARSALLNRAREVLTDPVQREAYDRTLRPPARRPRALTGRLGERFVEVSYVICVRCGAKNRVAAIAPLRGGQCGRCSRPFVQSRRQEHPVERSRSGGWFAHLLLGWRRAHALG